MRLSLPAKLTTIAASAAVGFVLLMVTGAITDNEVSARMTAIQEHYIPRVQVRPRLENELERMTRAFQDAVAAQDVEQLERARVIEGEMLDHLTEAERALDPAQVRQVRESLRAYRESAGDVSRRMIDGESGEQLVDAMAEMQSRRARAADAIDKATTFRADELGEAFMSGANAQRRAARIRLFTTLASLTVLVLLALWIRRDLLLALSALTAGLERFGRGNFAEKIPVVTDDEIGAVAERANEMAASLERLARERDRQEWLRNGTAGLSLELRGELEVRETAERALAFLAKQLEAPVGAIYYADEPRRFRLLGAHASPRAGDSAAPPTSFMLGEGLAGEAAKSEEIVVVRDPPASYLRIQSTIGSAAPRMLVFLPLVLGSDVRGIVELASFREWSPDANEFLRSARELVTIAIEVARAREAMRTLLVATQQQAARLASQEEELRATNEELQTQQEELRQANVELTQQTSELERQRKVLEEKNRELDVSQKRLEQKAAELASVSAYKSQFLANMSHELRTPLNSMLLLSSLLTENQTGNLTAKQVEYCRTIHGAGSDLLALINQVLDLAKIESGKQETHLERVPLDRFVEYARQLFTPLARNKKLSLVASLAEGLPATIVTDGQRVTQILNNLLGNALKFTERGEVSLHIQRPRPGTRFRRPELAPERTVAFVVTDSGLGIAPEHQERIFAPFEQVDGSIDRRYGGTGLGLAIARELSVLLGGELHLESALGKGSSFTFYLPESLGEVPVSSSGAIRAVSPSPVPAVAPSASPSARLREQPPIDDDRDRLEEGDEHLLIIEDDVAFARALGDLVHEQGCKLVAAYDGRSGLQLAKSLKPRGIVLDVMLPEVDGWRVLDALRRDPETRDIPVHFISALDASERAITMGAVGYLTKPATRAQLVSIIRALAPSTSRLFPVLLVEGTDGAEESLVRKVEGEGLEITRVSSRSAALDALEHARFACIVLDLSFRDTNVLDLLREIERVHGKAAPPALVYTDRALSKEETQEFQRYAQAIVLKQGSATARVLDEIRLFARRVKEEPTGRKAMRADLHQPPRARLDGSRVLVVDDDMRTVYALSAILRARGADVQVADSGLSALALLEARADFDVVLMDIMMPEMDGYAAMRAIRADSRFAKLPIIALTAKAMKGDEEQCLAAGANAYLPKPVEPDRLLAVIHSIAKRQPIDTTSAE